MPLKDVSDGHYEESIHGNNINLLDIVFVTASKFMLLRILTSVTCLKMKRFSFTVGPSF